MYRATVPVQGCTLPFYLLCENHIHPSARPLVLLYLLLFFVNLVTAIKLLSKFGIEAISSYKFVEKSLVRWEKGQLGAHNFNGRK